MARKVQHKILPWLNKFEMEELIDIREYGIGGKPLDLNDYFETNEGRKLMSVRSVINNLEHFGLIERNPSTAEDVHIYRCTEAGIDYFRTGPGE